MRQLEEAGLVPQHTSAELVLMVDDRTLDPTTDARATPAVRGAQGGGLEAKTDEKKASLTRETTGWTAALA